LERLAGSPGHLHRTAVIWSTHLPQRGGALCPSGRQRWGDERKQAPTAGEPPGANDLDPTPAVRDFGTRRALGIGTSSDVIGVDALGPIRPLIDCDTLKPTPTTRMGTWKTQP